MLPEILYEDDHLYVVYKPAGMESQSGRNFSMDLCSYLMNRQAKAGVRQPYVGVIHRLDRNVAGVMVYAKTKRAAAALSRQVTDGTMEKYYKALLCGQPEAAEGELRDYLLQNKQTNSSSVAEEHTEGAKPARLTYRIIGTEELACLKRQLPMMAWKQAESGELTGVEIHLLTGRHHQIRVQFSSRGLPLWGDVKYNPAFAGKKSPCVALCAWKLVFVHPITDRQMEFSLA